MSSRLARVTVLIALIAGACSSTTTRTTVANTTTTSTAGASTSSTDPIEVPSPPITLIRIDDPSFDGGFLNAVTTSGSGLIAVGSDELPENAAVWVSTDGHSWERIESDTFSGTRDDDGLEGSQAMTSIVEGPAGIVAVGWFERRAERDFDPAVWLSPDGREWERIDDPAFVVTGPGYMYSVTTWNGRYVAAGETPGPVGSNETRPAIWLSDDGRTWEAIDAAALRIDGTIADITSRGTRLFAVGTTGHVARPTVWFSDDGQSWDVISAEDAGDSMVGSIDIGGIEQDEDIFMNAIVVTPDGFIASGGTGEPSRAIFWESPDGLFWTLTAILSDIERPTAPVFAESMTATSNGIVAVGSGRLDTTRFPPLSYAEVWVSTDSGLTWAQVPRESNSTVLEGPSAPWHMGWMTDLIRVEGGVLAVGFVPYRDVTLPGPFYHQAVWIGTWE